MGTYELFNPNKQRQVLIGSVISKGDGVMQSTVSNDYGRDRPVEALGQVRSARLSPCRVGASGSLDEGRAAQISASAAYENSPAALTNLWTDDDHHSYLSFVERLFTRKLYHRQFCEPDICGVPSGPRHNASSSSSWLSESNSDVTAVTDSEAEEQDPSHGQPTACFPPPAGFGNYVATPGHAPPPQGLTALTTIPYLNSLARSGLVPAQPGNIPAANSISPSSFPEDVLAASPLSPLSLSLLSGNIDNGLAYTSMLYNRWMPPNPPQADLNEPGSTYHPGVPEPTLSHPDLAHPSLPGLRLPPANAASLHTELVQPFLTRGRQVPCRPAETIPSEQGKGARGSSERRGIDMNSVSASADQFPLEEGFDSQDDFGSGATERDRDRSADGSTRQALPPSAFASPWIQHWQPHRTSDGGSKEEDDELAIAGAGLVDDASIDGLLVGDSKATSMGNPDVMQMRQLEGEAEQVVADKLQEHAAEANLGFLESTAIQRCKRQRGEGWLTLKRQKTLQEELAEAEWKLEREYESAQGVLAAGQQRAEMLATLHSTASKFLPGSLSEKDSDRQQLLPQQAMHHLERRQHQLLSASAGEAQQECVSSASHMEASLHHEQDQPHLQYSHHLSSPSDEPGMHHHFHHHHHHYDITHAHNAASAEPLPNLRPHQTPDLPLSQKPEVDSRAEKQLGRPDAISDGRQSGHPSERSRSLRRQHSADQVVPSDTFDDRSFSGALSVAGNQRSNRSCHVSSRSDNGAAEYTLSIRPPPPFHASTHGYPFRQTEPFHQLASTSWVQVVSPPVSAGPLSIDADPFPSRTARIAQAKSPVEGVTSAPQISGPLLAYLREADLTMQEQRACGAKKTAEAKVRTWRWGATGFRRPVCPHR